MRRNEEGPINVILMLRDENHIPRAVWVVSKPNLVERTKSVELPQFQLYNSYNIPGFTLSYYT